MTDEHANVKEPTTKIDAVAPQDSRIQSGGSAGVGKSTPPAPSQTADPARREFDEQSDEADGEDHERPHADPTMVPSADRSVVNRSIPVSQPIPRVDAKPTVVQTGGSAAV